MVTVPTAIAVARPYMWRESIPISSAVSRSWAVARIERPVSVRLRNSWSPPEQSDRDREDDDARGPGSRSGQ